MCSQWDKTIIHNMKSCMWKYMQKNTQNISSCEFNYFIHKMPVKIKQLRSRVIKAPSIRFSTNSLRPSNIYASVN